MRGTITEGQRDREKQRKTEAKLVEEQRERRERFLKTFSLQTETETARMEGELSYKTGREGAPFGAHVGGDRDHGRDERRQETWGRRRVEGTSLPVATPALLPGDTGQSGPGRRSHSTVTHLWPSKGRRWAQPWLLPVACA